MSLLNAARKLKYFSILSVVAFAVSISANAGEQIEKKTIRKRIFTSVDGECVKDGEPRWGNSPCPYVNEGFTFTSCDVYITAYVKNEAKKSYILIPDSVSKNIWGAKEEVVSIESVTSVKNREFVRGPETADDVMEDAYAKAKSSCDRVRRYTMGEMNAFQTKDEKTFEKARNCAENEFDSKYFKPDEL